MLVTEILEKVWNLTDTCKIGKKRENKSGEPTWTVKQIGRGNDGWVEKTDMGWTRRKTEKHLCLEFSRYSYPLQSIQSHSMSLLKVDNTATGEWTQHPGIFRLSRTFGQGHHSRLVDQNSNPALRAVEVMDCFPPQFSILTYSFSLRSEWQSEGWCTKDKCCFLRSVARNGFGPGRHTTGCVKREGSQPPSILPPHLYHLF